MTIDTTPNDISFNTFNDTNLNYNNSGEKIIKLPAINFNIATHYLPPLIYLFIGLRFGTLPLFALWSAPLSASTVLLPAAVFLPLLLFWLSHPVKSGKSV